MERKKREEEVLEDFKKIKSGDENMKCPVCGKYTFRYAGDDDTCETCGWINDMVQLHYPDDEGGANHISLREARKQYASGKLKWMP